MKTKFVVFAFFAGWVLSSTAFAEGLKISYPDKWNPFELNNPITPQTPTLTPPDKVGHVTFSGSLPDGLKLDASTGTISGTPKHLMVPHQPFVIKAVVNGKPEISGADTINISVSTPPTIVYSKGSYQFINGKAILPHHVTLTPPMEVDHVVFKNDPSTPLPEGLLLDATTGAISGTPTKHGKYSVTITATMKNRIRLAGSVTLAIRVVEPANIAAQEPIIVIKGTDSISVSGGVAPYQLSLSGGGQLSSDTIDHDGGSVTYTAPESSTQVTITATDSAQQVQTVQAGVQVVAALVSCGKDVVNQDVNATPAIEACMKQLDPSKGGIVNLAPGVYTLKTQLDLTPDGKPISNLTLQTDGVPAGHDCFAPADTSENIGYPPGVQPPTKVHCAILKAADNFLGDTPAGQIKQNGAVVLTSAEIKNSTINQIIIDGNHQNRSSGTLYNGCYNIGSPRGFNVAMHLNTVTYNYVQSVNALCGGTFGAETGSTGVLFNHVYVGQSGGLYDTPGHTFWCDGLGVMGGNMVVQYSTIEDVHDYDIIVGELTGPDGYPTDHDIPVQVIGNFIYQHTKASVMAIGLNDWLQGETGYFKNIDGKQTVVKDNTIDCTDTADPGKSDCGSGVRLGNEFNSPAQDIVDGGYVSGNKMTCTGGGAAGYPPNISCRYAEDFTITDTNVCKDCNGNTVECRGSTCN